MKIECAYANEKEQYLIALNIKEGAKIEDVIFASGVLERFPELDFQILNVGIFGEKKSLKDEVCEGDRVEIYRPLILDPMEARRRRAPAPKRRKF